MNKLKFCMNCTYYSIDKVGSALKFKNLTYKCELHNNYLKFPYKWGHCKDFSENHNS